MACDAYEAARDKLTIAPILEVAEPHDVEDYIGTTQDGVHLFHKVYKDAPGSEHLSGFANRDACTLFLSSREDGEDATGMVWSRYCASVQVAAAIVDTAQRGRTPGRIITWEIKGASE